MSFNNIKLVKIFDIQIQIHASWFIVFLLISWTLATSYFPYFYPRLDSFVCWSMGVVAAILLFGSVLLHELSHSLVARKNGLPVRKITLFIFGGIAHMSDESPNASTEFKMAIAGPACSLVLALTFMSLSYFLKSANLWLPVYAVIKYLALINTVLAVFNLVPGFPLDGGRVLRAIIWYYTGDLKKSTLIASRIGKGFAILLGGFGLLNILFAHNLIGGLWLMFIGFFLHQAASMGYMQVSLKKALSGILVKDIMKEDVVAVLDSITIETLINDYFFKYHYQSFPVVSGRKLEGVITLNKIRQISKDKWGQLNVADVMDKDIDAVTVCPSDEAVSVINKIIKNDIPQVLVINTDKEVIGLLTRRDIMQVLKLRTDLGI